MNKTDLFGDPVYPHLLKGSKVGPKGGKHYVRPQGFRGMPGAGPAGESCRTCKHRVILGYHNKTYPKCGLMKERWTHGRGTDILVSSPACEYWERDE